MAEYLQERQTFHTASISLLLASGLCVITQKELLSPWLGVIWPHAHFVTLVFISPLLQEGRYRPRGDPVPPQLSFLSQSGFHNFPLTLRWDSKFHYSSGLINLHFFVPWACHVIQLWFVGREKICKSAHLAVIVRLDSGV